LAPAKPIAGVVRARVGIVAEHWVANTLPNFTMIPNGAGIAVLALAAFQYFVVAADLAVTGVDGTLIAVVTEVNVVPANLIRLIDIAVAIVINTVAGLGLRNRSITVTQTTFQANTFAHASTPLSNNLASGPKRQLYRLLGAWTLPSISHALQYADPIDGDCRETRKTPGAVFVKFAVAAAKPEAVVIGDTRIFLAAWRLTVGVA